MKINTEELEGGYYSGKRNRSDLWYKMTVRL